MSILRTSERDHLNSVALILRAGLGLVFIIGGWSKLNLLLSDATHQSMVDTYLSPNGYINALFQDYLFTGATGDWISPAGFLTTLSTFELLSGIALVAGFMVRPLSLMYGLMLWTFVVGLPVVTVPGVSLEVDTYTSPAIFVQIRDIALSGMMFVLFNLGAGRYALDQRFAPRRPAADWDAMGLLLRLSLAAPLIVGGFFAGYDHIQSFAMPGWLLAIGGILLVFGSPRAVSATGAAMAAVLFWHLVQKTSLDRSLTANLNSYKRELALVAAGAALAFIGGGVRFTGQDLLIRMKHYHRRMA